MVIEIHHAEDEIHRLGAFSLLAHVAFMLETRRSVAPAPRGTAEAPGLKRAPSPPALGAIVVAAPRLPRLKEWAYAGMIFDLTGAGISRAVTGDSASTVVMPLMLAGVVLASWSLRPPARRLGITTSNFGRDT